VLWYGRQTNVNIGNLVNFVTLKAMLIGVTQITAMCFFQFVSIPVYSQYLQIGLATIFTWLSGLLLLFDEDIESVQATTQP